MAETIPGPSEVTPVVPPPDYLCPHCGDPATTINVTAMGSLLIFWHAECRHMLNVQLISIPPQAQGRIVIPGRTM